MNVKKHLAALADEKYRAFAASLLPGNETPMLGVRMPLLRALAKELARERGAQALAPLSEDTLEEIMLQGLVIGLLKGGPEEIFPLVKNFVPKITNWSVCDSFCAGLKLADKHPRETWDFLQPYFTDSREYFFRFAAVTGLFHFAKGPYALRLFPLLENARADGFYAKMASAWAVSVLCVHKPEETLAFLQADRLDDFTHNKAIQKITESFRVSPEHKARARTLKRRAR